MNGEEGASGFDMISPYARVYGRAHLAQFRRGDDTCIDILIRSKFSYDT